MNYKLKKGKRMARFLHERKAVPRKANLLWKGREKEWAKEKYKNKLKEKEEKAKSGYVTKNMYELQFGFKDQGDWYVYDNKTSNKKYFDKFEFYRGTHEKKERR